jgi:hypothetical protein
MKPRRTAAVRRQPEIIMFGTRLWPPVAGASYYRDQLLTAVNFYRDFSTWARPDETPRARAVMLRLLVRRFREYATRTWSVEQPKIQQVFELVHLIAGLLEGNPTGECSTERKQP